MDDNEMFNVLMGNIYSYVQNGALYVFSEMDFEDPIHHMIIMNKNVFFMHSTRTRQIIIVNWTILGAAKNCKYSPYKMTRLLKYFIKFHLQVL